MGFFKEHLWPTLGIVFGGLWTLYGILSQGYDLWTAGMPPVVWIAVGALIFMATVVVLFMRLHRRMTNVSGSALPPATARTEAQTRVGAASTRDVFQNEELRFWDLIGRSGTTVKGKTFVECDFYGPAVVAVLDHVHMEGCTLVSDNVEINLIEVVKGRVVTGVFGLSQCKFLRCRFNAMSFIGPPEDMQKLRDAFNRRSG